MPLEISHPTSATLVCCSGCGHPLMSVSEHCPECGRSLRPSRVTWLLRRPPLQRLIGRYGKTRLLPSYRVMLQVLPSGACLALPTIPQIVLGRGDAEAGETLIDLDEHNAYQRGVSRRHCVILRQSDHLYIVDQGSSNGTSLNGEPLVAHQRYSLADGDKLILGSMHFSVSFFPPDMPLGGSAI